MFCTKCGKELYAIAFVCVGCGSKVKNDHRGLITIILLSLFGLLGAHRFYTGHITAGIIQLFTLGGLGIWVSLDFFQLLSGNFKDIEGNIIEVI